MARMLNKAAYKHNLNRWCLLQLFMRQITDRHGAHCLQLSKLLKSERLILETLPMQFHAQLMDRVSL
jgi:hypothetical protein